MSEKKGCVPKLRFPEFKNSGEWEEKAIGKILKIGSGKDYKHLQKGNIPVYGTGGYMLSVDDYLYDGESVCIGRKGTIDKPLYLTGKFWTVDTLFYTHSFQNNIPKFIYLLFQKINWQKYNEASGVPSLSKKTIENIRVLLPPRPQEQQKIADFLSSLDEVIESEEQKLTALQKHKKGLMQRLFPQEGEKTPRLRFPEFKDNGEWEEKEIGTIANIRKGIQLNRLDMIENGRYPVINGGIEASGYIDDFNANENTITISEGGNSCGYVNWIKTKFWCGGHCYRLENIKINRIFLYFALKKEENKITKLRVGSGLPNIQKKDLIRYKFYISPTIPEQQKIADCLSSLDELIELQTKKIELLKKHKKGLMQGLFPSEEDCR